ncbi:2-amino-3,7-dideoxy-D-threo-hept-6-ulosonate synthase [Haloactinomyces albus]|uniref:2-amino-4, 5-dihydroxy-6-oxo-7-(Phosphonooxy)heptanoate synthase n=1 Tax=Haloactinomyces albus TaxID=1352928 RepID=A0AAE3ZDM9_9ACTN|nr:2-amino-3,7-dideoxy-D-threo-hept-6-ulosonate synthase [Haloactinomyces albus]MDR7301965.1 2-amino-4,5-dihydroxy-6-oxo-7-(phosphonooxy)heptanoate synthase [Haloactinomyces albus]
MTRNSFARDLRVRRLFRRSDDNLMIVPLDHSMADGPITTGTGLDRLVGQMAHNDVDAVVLHKGRIRHVDHGWFAHTSLIVHLSASTAHASDPDSKYLVAGVEESLRLGADAVSVHVNLGSDDERTQIADMAAVAEACDRWNLPLLAMIYPRGPRVVDPRDPDMVAHAASLAADLGVDIVKTMHVGSADKMAEIVDSCPIPIVVAGGPKAATTGHMLSYIDEVMSSGIAGVAMGRNIFQADDPGSMAKLVADRVHSATPSSVSSHNGKLTVAVG